MVTPSNIPPNKPIISNELKNELIKSIEKDKLNLTLISTIKTIVQSSLISENLNEMNSTNELISTVENKFDKRIKTIENRIKTIEKNQKSWFGRIRNFFFPILLDKDNKRIEEEKRQMDEMKSTINFIATQKKMQVLDKSDVTSKQQNEFLLELTKKQQERLKDNLGKSTESVQEQKGFKEVERSPIKLEEETMKSSTTQIRQEDLSKSKEIPKEEKETITKETKEEKPAETLPTDELPPPPPPPDGLPPPPPPISMVVPKKIIPPEKLFAGEPEKEPSFDTRIGKLSMEEIEKQLPQITEYLNTKKAALGLINPKQPNADVNIFLNEKRMLIKNQVKIALNRKSELPIPTSIADSVEQLRALISKKSEIEEGLAERKKELEEAREQLEMFQTDDDIVLPMKIPNKGGEPIEIKQIFYKHRKDWEAENLKRTNEERTPLPVDYLQEVQTKIFTSLMVEAQNSFDKINEELAFIEKNIKNLSVKSNNNIPFDNESIKIFDDKIKLLEKWESALKMRKNKLQGPQGLNIEQKSTSPIKKTPDPLKTNQAYLIALNSGKLNQFIDWTKVKKS